MTNDAFDGEYLRYRRRQRIHRMHLVGYVVSAALVLIGMLLFLVHGGLIRRFVGSGVWLQVG